MGNKVRVVFAGGVNQKQKYDNNPLHMRLINGFIDNLVELMGTTEKKRTFEIGCGEGQLMGVLHGMGYDVSGMDIDPTNVKTTRENFKNIGVDEVNVFCGNLYDLDQNDERLKKRMLICCEVLEHVDDPEKALSLISSLTDEYFIVSVPHEPIWRMLNMVRGKYWKDFGNTPGHINHWTKKDYIELVSKYGEILEVRTPLPWTMILAKRLK